VTTNRQIISISDVEAEPIDFLDEALDIIDERKAAGNSLVGPENYATALKFFADKYWAIPTTHLDQTIIKELVDRSMDGFVEVAAEDKPNFVELSNLYVVICKLPKGSVDPIYSEPIVAHSLDTLPDYDSGILKLARAAMAKLDLSSTAESAATFIDLSMRKGTSFETTLDMRQSLSAIANLPKSRHRAGLLRHSWKYAINWRTH